jgi:Tol biopolymer transport system component
MSKVDDELTRRFHRAERPFDSDALFEGISSRRRRREAIRRVEVGFLALAVVVATAGGFFALRSMFDPDTRNVGSTSPVNGEMVFSRKADGHSHLFAARPDGSGERQITEGNTDDLDAAVSPGGETIAYVHELDRGTRIQVIATVPFDGGIVSWHTSEDLEAIDPAWSPDGERIAFVGWDEQEVPSGSEAPQRYRAIFTVDATNGRPQRVTDGGIPFTSDPTWSPDGRSIAFAGGSCASACDEAIQSDLYIVDVSSTNVHRLTSMSGDIDEEAPAWSPDGTRIAFTRPGDRGDEVWTVAPDGTHEALLASAVEASLEPDLAWAPDGSALLVSDGEWIYRVDAMLEGDPRDNFVQLVRGHSPAWQPVPAASEPSASATLEPSASPSPAAEARDIGLGFPLCDIRMLDGVDWYGDGTDGAAWTGAREAADGRCPEQATGDYVVAADLDGDGRAEPGGMGFLASCLFCRPYAATDLDTDGVLEMVVLEEASSTPSFSFFEVSLPTSERSPGIYNLSVAPPGHPEAGIRPGSPLRISTGGDEGFAGWIGCAGRGGELILQVTWRTHPIEGGVQDVHETDLALRHGIFVVVASRDYELPRGAPVPRASDEPACGVDWQI